MLSIAILAKMGNQMTDGTPKDTLCTLQIIPAKDTVNDQIFHVQQAIQLFAVSLGARVLKSAFDRKPGGDILCVMEIPHTLKSKVEDFVDYEISYLGKVHLSFDAIPPLDDTATAVIVV